jgi:hypothetical protein
MAPTIEKCARCGIARATQHEIDDNLYWGFTCACGRGSMALSYDEAVDMWNAQAPDVERARRSAAAIQQQRERRETRRVTILKTVEDMVRDFLIYDRKEDEGLGSGEIEAAIGAGEIDADAIVVKFEQCLRGGLE